MEKDIEVRIKKYYDNVFATYGKDAKFMVEKNWNNNLRYFLEYFYSHIKRDNSKTILLDVGCGTGLVSKELLKHGFRVSGVDFSSEVVKFAREENPGVDFTQSSIYELPFLDGTFDIVVCLGVFQTVEHSDRAIAEMGRVLKKGGILIVRTLNTLFLLSFRGKRDNPVCIFYNPFSFKKMMEKEGFNVFPIRGIFSFPPKLDFLSGFFVRIKLYKVFNFLFFPIFVFFSHGFYIEGVKK